MSGFKMKNIARFAPPGAAPSPRDLVNCHLWEHLRGIVPSNLMRAIDQAVQRAVEDLIHEGLVQLGGRIDDVVYPEDDWLTLTLNGVDSLDRIASPLGPSTMTTRTATTRVFISYTHEDPAHKAWVLHLATDLRSRGVDVVLDQWELKMGADLTLFMEAGVRDADRVLLILTPTYRTKANQRTGGVGYESLTVTGELAKDLATSKFVGVLRRGDWTSAVPSFLATRNHLDMRDDGTYSTRLDDLLRDLHNTPASPKPPVGPNPFTP